MSAAPSTSSAAPDGASASEAPTTESLRAAIISRGEEVRTLRATGNEADNKKAAVALEALLQLKAQYLGLTGEEYRKSTKRGRDATATAASTNPARRPKQPRLVKPPKDAEELRVDPMKLPPPASEFPAWSPRDFFKFEVLHRSRKPGSRARVGRITTPHGVIDTPAFVPVGTNAALKCLDERHAREAGVQLMFCNTCAPPARPPIVPIPHPSWPPRPRDRDSHACSRSEPPQF
jgi:hypothetical protein